ncbi:hypothetical protein Golomagni_06836, partial [Golovinomyces magnicellulatus]
VGEHAESERRHDAAQLAHGGAKAVCCGSDARWKYLGRHDERRRIAAGVEAELEQHKHHKERRGVVDDVRVRERKREKQHRVGSKSEQLDLFTSHHLDQRYGDVVSRKEACQHNDEVAQSKLVDLVPRAALRVPDERKDGRLVEIDAVEGDVHEEPGERGAEQHAQRESPLELSGDESDDDSDDEDVAIKPVFSAIAAPSRIKSKAEAAKSKSKPKTESKPAAVPEEQTGVLAPTDPNTSFASLDVSPWLVQSLSNMAIKRPTGIQKGCIPEILKGRDCIGGSRTGSGKTVAFAVPILQKWAEDPTGIFGVVLTPTRELALQIYEQFKAISSPQGLKAVLITGGADQRAQAITLAQRPHVVIATPGRLADHIRTSGEDTICGLRRVRFVVLDEADRLLHAGGTGSMLPDVEECLGVLPPSVERQTLLFTATITPEVRALKDMPVKPGKQPVFVCEVDTQMLAIPATLSQKHVQIPVTHKEHYLHVFLSTEANEDKTVILFCNRTSTAEFLHHLLRLLDHRVTSLHSKLPQRQRIDNLA